MIRRALVSALWGALAGAALSAGLFVVGALLDGTGLAEAVAYGLGVALAGAFLGGITGGITGLGDFGLLGGALAGLLVALAVVALYVLGFGRAGQAAYYLSESRVLIAVLAAPLALSGILAAWRRQRPLQP